MSLPGLPMLPPEPPPYRPPRILWRQRPIELGLLVGCPVAVVLTLLFWTAVLPGLYPSSPIVWTQETSNCPTTNVNIPHVERTFPLWAMVHVHWTATGPVDYWAYFGADIDQLGTIGNATFPSHNAPVVFQPMAWPEPPGSPCSTINVTTTVTYSVWE